MDSKGKLYFQKTICSQSSKGYFQQNFQFLQTKQNNDKVLIKIKKMIKGPETFKFRFESRGHQNTCLAQCLNEFIIQQIMERSDLLYITLNRIWCDSLNDNSKVIIVVMNGQHLLLKSSVKSIRNGSTYFYRQSFQVPFSPNLQFQIKDLQTNSSLTYLPLSSHLKQLKVAQKNAFQSTSQGYKLLWEVQIDNGKTEKKGQLTERELFDSTDDFVPIGGALSYLQPATKIRQKRRLSAKTKDNSDAVSQPSQPFEKIGQLNNFHKKVSIDFQTVQKCESTAIRKQSQISLVKQEHRRDLKLSQRVPKMQQSPNVKLTVQSCLVFKSPSKYLCKNKIQKSPENNLKRCRSNFLGRLGVKEMISSAVLGIVSGLAATQF